MLRVENLTVLYHNVISVLHGLSLEAKDNTITTLLGGNGSGKTTLMRAIAGILDIYDGNILEGTIELDGQKIHRKSVVEITRKLRLTYLLDDRPIFQYLTVTENLKAASFCRWDSQVARDTEGVLEYFPRLRERLKSKAGYLSGGERQMLCLGMALMTNPKFLLLDEPSLGLAPILIKKLFEIIQKIQKDEHISILLCEQNAQMAISISSYGYVMENGRVVLDGTAQELSENNDIRESYLGTSGEDQKDYKESKRYKRRKRWL